VNERHRELVTRAYEAINRGDVEAALESLDPAMELVTSGAFLDEGTVYRGPQGVLEFFAMLQEAFDDISYELGEMIEPDPGRVLVLLRIRGHGKGSGLDVDRETAHIWTIRDLKCIRLEAFSDAESGRAAAGLT
jgi:ketosteroid isomerase-like protein